MIITTSIILIFLSVWNFGNVIDTDTIEIVSIVDVSTQLENALNVITEKELLIYKYQNEILNLTKLCNSLNEKLSLTQHSLNMANEALNNLVNEGQVDHSSDYEQ